MSVAGASTVAGRLVQKFGNPITTPWPQVSHHFPYPALLASLSIEELATIGIPKSRAATIKSFAQFAFEGGLLRSPACSLDDFVAKLKRLPGIGEWTAQYIAMRAMRFSNAFPAGDLGLQKAISAYTQAPCTEKQLLAKSQAWSPWRSYAALLLWHT